MAYLTDYGGIWGAVPQTAGQVFWVAPGAGAYTVNGQAYTASDGNDGLSPERAFATADKGVNSATNNGDVVVLLPGSHSPTASLAMDTAGVTLMGLPSGAGNFLRQKTTIAAVTGDENLNITAEDCEVAYLHFVPVTAITALDISLAGARAHIHHCSFDLETAAANVGTIGIEFLGATPFPYIHDCYFASDGAQGPGIVMGVMVQGLVENCLLSGTGCTWEAAMSSGAGGSANLIKDVTILASACTITDGITGGASVVGGWTFLRCNFPVTTDEIDGFTPTHAEVNQNFIATIGGGSGGTQTADTT